ncbi:MAG: CdaR family protein [candidate division Zixibacteria bacterium]
MSGSMLNIVIKLAALLLAVLLWFNVVSQKQYEYDISLPLKVFEFPDDLAAITAWPESLTVKVQADGSILLRNDWKEDGLRLRGGRLKRGYNNFIYNLETIALVRSEGISLLEIVNSPEARVQLDRVDSAYRPIASLLAVVPDEDYMVVKGTLSIEPSEVMITGPASVLRQIDSVFTEAKIIDNVDEPVSYNAKLEVSSDAQITFGHDSATVNINIDRILSRRIDSVQVSIEKAINDKTIILDPATISLVVSGPESYFDSLVTSSLTAQIDLPTDALAGYAVPQVDLPPNFSIVKIIPDSIRVVITP